MGYRLLCLCSIFIFLFQVDACAAVQREGELFEVGPFRSQLRDLVNQKVIRGDAQAVHLDTNALLTWVIEEITIDRKTYEKRIQESVIDLGKTDFAIYCERSIETPLWYTNYNPKIQALETTKSRLTLEAGKCFQLSQKSKTGISTIVGIYNFQQELSIQIPDLEQHARLEVVLDRFSYGVDHKGIDKSVVKVGDIFVGEATGYLLHPVLGPIPGRVLFDKKDDRYYRLVLIGKRTFVVLDIKYPLKMSFEELHYQMKAVIAAFRYVR